MWIDVVASELKIAVGLEVPSRFVGQVLARLATGLGAGVIVAHRSGESQISVANLFPYRDLRIDGNFAETGPTRLY